jgi:hypothetical protein
MYEHHRNPLLSPAEFIVRMIKSIAGAFCLVAASLLIGMLGYHGFEGLAWIDAFLNASMILSGMGPVNPVVTVGGKIFAGCYALFSGLALISVLAMVAAPLFHRFLHKFHLERGD